MPCGNTVAMVGLDQFITKNATLTNEKAEDAHPIKAMKFSVSPVVSLFHPLVLLLLLIMLVVVVVLLLIMLLAMFCCQLLS